MLQRHIYKQPSLHTTFTFSFHKYTKTPCFWEIYNSCDALYCDWCDHLDLVLIECGDPYFSCQERWQMVIKTHLVVLYFPWRTKAVWYVGTGGFFIYRLQNHIAYCVLQAIFVSFWSNEIQQIMGRPFDDFYDILCAITLTCHPIWRYTWQVLVNAYVHTNIHKTVENDVISRFPLCVSTFELIQCTPWNDRNIDIDIFRNWPMEYQGRTRMKYATNYVSKFS